MNYKAIQDEVVTFRFNETRRGSVKNWILQRYAWVWGQCDWPFRRVDPTSLTITGGDSTPTMPSDFDRVSALYDGQGNELEQLLPHEFDEAFEDMAIANSQGVPVAFKVVNRVLTLGPAPSTGATYQLAYERLLACRNGSLTITAGPMTNDTDQPIWDSGHHYMLVVGAMATGMKMESDPTWQSLEAEFQQAFQAMQEDLLPPDRTITTQFGAGSL